MSWKSTATTLAVVASLAVGGHAAASIRGESRSDRARPSQVSHPQPESVLLNAARVQAASLGLSVENKTRRDSFRRRQIDLFMLVYVTNLKKASAELQRRAQAERQRHTRSVTTSHRASRSVPVGNGFYEGAPATGRNCGGDLPPCWIMMRESRGVLTARNPSGAAGKWQIMPGTWGNFMGYASAADAPEAVQDARARQLPLCNWQPPNYCGG